MAEEEAKKTWTPIKEAVDDLWTAFLTPPQGNLLSFCRVLMEHDKRLPPHFLAGFIDHFKKLRNWNPSDDPEYELPRQSMKILYHIERDKIKKKEREQRKKQRKEEKEMEIEPTAEEIEENKKRLKKRIQVSKTLHVKSQIAVSRSNKLGRLVKKLEATVKNLEIQR